MNQPVSGGEPLPSLTPPPTAAPTGSSPPPEPILSPPPPMPPSMSPPPPPNPTYPPGSGSPTFPIVVRYNRQVGVVFIVAGVLLAWMAIANDSFPVGLIFVVLGVLYMSGKVAVVEPNLVSIKNPLQMTLKKRPIDGLGDLYFKGNKLYRRSDDRKIQNLGWGTSRTSDLNHLKQAVAAAQPSRSS